VTGPVAGPVDSFPANLLVRLQPRAARRRLRRARGLTVSKLKKCLCGTRYALRCTGMKLVCRMAVQAKNFSQSDSVNPMHEIFKLQVQAPLTSFSPPPRPPRPQGKCHLNKMIQGRAYHIRIPVIESILMLFFLPPNPLFFFCDIFRFFSGLILSQRSHVLTCTP